MKAIIALPANKRLLLVLISVFIILISFFATYQIKERSHVFYQQYAFDLQNKVQDLIDNKRKSTLAVSLALAGDETIKNILRNPAANAQLKTETHNLSLQLREYTRYKNVWIHVIDKQGISRSRSWSDKSGDNIVDVRLDVKKMLANPQIMETISAGIFSMSFKSMVPIKNGDGLLGIVEVITHFNSIITDLDKEGMRTLVLLDKKYKQQLSKPISRTFVDDYYVVNFIPDPNLVNYISEQNIESFIQQRQYKLDKQQLITFLTIPDVNSQAMGYVFVVKSISDVANTKLILLLKQLFLFTSVFFLSLLLWFLYKNRKFEQQQKQYLRNIIDSSEDIVLVSDLKQILLHNNAFSELFGAASQPYTVDAFTQYINIDKLAIAKLDTQSWSDYFSQHLNIDMDVLCNKQQQSLWFSLRVQPLLDSPEKFIIRLVNITTRRQAEEKIRLYANVFTHAGEGIVITDSTTTIVDCNSAFTDITGYTRQDVIGKNPKLLNSGLQDSDFFQKLWADVNACGQWHGEIWNRKKDGTIYAELLTINSIKNNDNSVVYYVGIFADISSQKQLQNQLEHRAHHDALTGLPNRILFNDRLKQAMSLTLRNHEHLSIAFLDLDGFKYVNDTYGHDCGDELLITIADRIRMIIREEDTFARFGGDEFVLLLINVDVSHYLQLLLTRILNEIALPVIINDHDIRVSSSIGVTVFPAQEQSGCDPESLLQQADKAMYAAKTNGKNQFVLYSPDM